MWAVWIHRILEHGSSAENRKWTLEVEAYVSSSNSTLDLYISSITISLKMLTVFPVHRRWLLWSDHGLNENCHMGSLRSKTSKFIHEQIEKLKTIYLVRTLQIWGGWGGVGVGCFEDLVSLLCCELSNTLEDSLFCFKRSAWETVLRACELQPFADSGPPQHHLLLALFYPLCRRMPFLYSVGRKFCPRHAAEVQ